MPLSFDAMAGERGIAPVQGTTDDAAIVKVETLDAKVSKVVKASKRLRKRLELASRTVDTAIVRLNPDVEVTYDDDGKPVDFQHYTFASGETLPVVLPKPQRKAARTPKRQGSRLPSPQLKRGYGIEPDVKVATEYDVHNIPAGFKPDDVITEQLARQSSRAIRRARFQAKRHALEHKATGTSDRTAYGTVYTDSAAWPHG